MRYILYFILFLFSFSVCAQELNCTVNIQTNPKLDITSSEQEILEDLEQQMNNLLNNTVWTDDRFEVEERINCAFQLSITKVNGGGNYEGNLQIQSTRPVFNTSYNTTLFNFLDKNVSFSYNQGTKFMFSDNQYTNNLTSILGFYAYLILGLDGDSFAPEGGEPYLQKAQNVVQMAQSSMLSGWQSSTKGHRNRYWLIKNYLQALFKPLRECMYQYHREGLDQLFKHPTEARTAIQEALEKLLKINSTRPGSVNVMNFMECKRDELGNIFRNAENKQKADVLNMLKKIDPTNSSEYMQNLQ